MALGHIIEVVLDLMSIPVPSREARTDSERMQRVATIGIWIVLVLAVALGLVSYFASR